VNAIETAPRSQDRLQSPRGGCEHQPSIDRLRARLNSVLRGKQDVVELVLACLLARGHLLFEDLPGLGKTTLAKAIAHAVGGEFARVQCTPDLLPGDVTGFNVFNQQTRQFEFIAGPAFADVLLADEINRATPRTQSALFEAMAERQVTIDNVRRPLARDFFVIATQNPIEQQGTYPLPEAQLDRFAVKLSIGYPDRASEVAMLSEERSTDSSSIPPPVLSREQLVNLQDHVAKVAVTPIIVDYLVDLARATRSHPLVTLGASPRGLLLWKRMSQAWAHLQGRDFVTPDDVQEVAVPVLSVRLIGSFTNALGVIGETIHSVAVPVLK
jgi:MoxR-like ATPase